MSNNTFNGLTTLTHFLLPGKKIVITLARALAAAALLTQFVSSGAAEPIYAPLSRYAIFYNGLLEFSTCATMLVNGSVHCNTNIYVGAGSGATLTFNTEVTASGTISAPTNNGQNWGNAYNFNTNNWLTTFNGSPTPYATNVATIQLALPMTNAHSIIDMPLTSDYMTTTGATRLYNQAQVILLISNTTVNYIVQEAPDASSLPAADGSKYTSPLYSTNTSVLVTNLPFLTLTNKFYDGREFTTNITAQIDVGKYANWLATNAWRIIAPWEYINSPSSASPTGSRLRTTEARDGPWPPQTRSMSGATITRRTLPSSTPRTRPAEPFPQP